MFQKYRKIHLIFLLASGIMLFSQVFTFHLWNMESIGFTCNFFKNDIRAKKNFRLSRNVARGFLDEIWGAASSAVWSARKLKFWLPASFEPTWCTSYSEFWNSLKTQESNFEICFENF
jgi:hypothetical protein